MDKRSNALDDAFLVMASRRPPIPVTEDDMRFMRGLIGSPDKTFVAARDEDGRPLAVGVAVIDEAVCLLQWAAASSHNARWALHDHLVQTLIARGVRFLVVDGGGMFGALGFAPNLQHYQRLLGYELVHLSPIPARSRPRTRPRVLALLFKAMAIAAPLAIPPTTSGATLSPQKPFRTSGIDVDGDATSGSIDALLASDGAGRGESRPAVGQPRRP